MFKKGLFLTLFIWFLMPILVFAYTDEKIQYPSNDLEEIKGNVNDNYVYYNDYKKIYRYDIKNNTFTMMYEMKENVIETYRRGNIIYIETFDTENPTFIGVDMTTKKEVYRKSYPIKKVYGKNFLVDDKKNIYLIDDNNPQGEDIIYIYNASGKLVSSYDDPNHQDISLKNISPDSNILFISADYYYSGYYTINNSKIINNSYITFGDVSCNWTFLNDKLHVVDQNGNLVKFVTSNVNKITYQVKASGAEVATFNYLPSMIEDGNKIYTESGDGAIYVINLDNYKKIAKLEIKPNAQILRMVKDGEKIHVVYRLNSVDYLTTINISDITPSKTITVNKHTTMNYTKAEVLKKYQESLSTYDYDKGYYEKLPSFTTPYYEGILKKEVKDDVLKQFNYYRYLAGLNTVTINNTYMQRSQKGAFINALNKTLTHNPVKSNGMTEDFYQEAKAGVGASLTYSGNVSAGTKVNYLVYGFVDDSNNVGDGVGHRESMLDPYAKSISFGYISALEGDSPWSYASGAMSVYFDGVNNNPDSFYAWPPAGYLPVESFPAMDNTLWSIWLDDCYKVTNETTMTIEYLGKEYKVSSLKRRDIYSSTLYYSIPTELNKLIMRDNHQYVTDKPLKFKLSNLIKGIDNINIEYTTTFIQAETIPLESLKLLVTENEFWYTTIFNNYKFQLNDKYKYVVDIVPTDSTVGNISVSSENPNVIYIDDVNKTLTAKGGGTTNIVLKDSLTGKTFKIKVMVELKSTGVALDRTSLTMLKGTTQKLTASLLPKGTTDEATFNWQSSNANVATVDKTGLITAKANGTTTITVTSSNGFKATCTVTVGDFLKGDLTENGKIEVADALQALYYYVGVNKTTSKSLAIADFDDNAAITVFDALKILNLYVNN